MKADIESLFAEHGRSVLQYLARRVEDPADAADLLSETILVAWRRRGSVPAPPADRPWLFGVARKILANHRRSLRRRTTAMHALAALVVDRVPGPRSDSLDVRRALASLDPVDREIVTLRAWDGLTIAEISTVLGMPVSTVHTRLVRTRGEIHEAVAERDVTAPSHG